MKLSVDSCVWGVSDRVYNELRCDLNDQSETFGIKITHLGNNQKAFDQSEGVFIQPPTTIFTFHDSQLKEVITALLIGSVYNHTRVSLPSSHTHVVVSETQGFG